MKTILWFLIFSCSIEAFPMPADAKHYQYLPARVNGATLFNDSGVIVDAGTGNTAGSIVVQHADGSTAIYFQGANLQINGATVSCLNYQFASPPPKKNVPSPSPYNSCNWPKTIIIGRTLVNVTYWIAKTIAGDTVNATDAISTGTGPNAKARLR